jgi:hypothetical protein
VFGRSGLLHLILAPQGVRPCKDPWSVTGAAHSGWSIHIIRNEGKVRGCNNRTCGMTARMSETSHRVRNDRDKMPLALNHPALHQRYSRHTPLPSLTVILMRIPACTLCDTVQKSSNCSNMRSRYSNSVPCFPGLIVTSICWTRRRCVHRSRCAIDCMGYPVPSQAFLIYINEISCPVR